MHVGVRKLCLLLVFLFCCLSATGGGVLPVSAAEDGSFSGFFVAQGSKDVLAYGGDRETSLFKLSGVVHLTNKLGKESDYWAECIGLADSETGSEIRCVWRSMDGDEVYLTLKGAKMDKGSNITGSIVGGTGAAKGITGTVRFTWSMMSFKQADKETGISGFSKDVTGTYKLP